MPWQISEDIQGFCYAQLNIRLQCGSSHKLSPAPYFKRYCCVFVKFIYCPTRCMKAVQLFYLSFCFTLSVQNCSLHTRLGYGGGCSENSIFTKLRKFSPMQCESKKIPPLRFSGIFSQTVGNFLSKFYTPVTRSYLR